MKKTKFLLCSLVGLLTFSMVSCGGTSGNNNQNPELDIEDHGKPDDNKDPNENDHEDEKVDFEKECLEIEKTKFVNFKKFEVINGAINYDISLNDQKINKNQIRIQLMNSKHIFKQLESLSGTVDNLEPNVTYWISVTLEFNIDYMNYNKEETSNSIYYAAEDNGAKVDFKANVFSTDYNFNLDISYLKYLKIDKVTLFKGTEKLKELEAIEKGTVSGLDEDTEYRLAFEYTYYASGMKANEKGNYESTFKTLKLDGLLPTIKVQNYNSFDKLLYSIEENSTNHTVIIKNVNLLDADEKKLNSKTEAQGVFENLAPGQTYYVELEYDFNDGVSTKTLKLKQEFKNAKYDYVNNPVLTFNTSKTVHEISYKVGKLDESVTLLKVELVKNSNPVQVKDTLEGTFENLDAYQTYTLRYTYSWIISSSNTKMENTEEVEVTTDYDYTCFSEPKLNFEYIDIRAVKFNIDIQNTKPGETISYHRTEIYEATNPNAYHYVMYSGEYNFEKTSLIPNTEYTVQMEYVVLKDGKEYSIIKYDHFKTLPFRLPEINYEIFSVSDNAVYYNFTCTGITDYEKDRFLSDTYVTKNGIRSTQYDYKEGENLWSIENLEPETKYELCIDYSYYDPITYENKVKTYKTEFTTLKKLPEIVYNKSVAYDGDFYYRFTKQTKDYCSIDVKSVGLYDGNNQLEELSPTTDLEGKFKIPTEGTYHSVIVKYDILYGDKVVHKEAVASVVNNYTPVQKPKVTYSRHQDGIIYMDINFSEVYHLTLYYDSVDVYTADGSRDYKYLKTQTSNFTKISGVGNGLNVKLVYHFRYVYDDLLKFEDYKFTVEQTAGTN